MSFRLLTASCLALSLITTTAFAANKEVIKCPGVDTIKQASDKIDAAEKYQGTFVAYSSNIAFKDDHSWFLGVANLNSATADEAVTAGKNLVKNASIKKTENAIKQDQYYFCVYGKGDIVAITGNFAMNGAMVKRLF